MAGVKGPMQQRAALHPASTLLLALCRRVHKHLHSIKRVDSRIALGRRFIAQTESPRNVKLP